MVLLIYVYYLFPFYCTLNYFFIVYCYFSSIFSLHLYQKYIKPYYHFIYLYILL